MSTTISNGYNAYSMQEKYKGKLYCFSPPVMLATFLIEFSLAFYSMWRYKPSLVRRLAITMLFALGTFQLSEYMVCGGLGFSNIEWARVGYASITLLPALGIHLIIELARKKRPILVASAYISCLVFVIVYLIGENAVKTHACTANYAVFDMIRASVWPFVSYYYGWLLVGVYLAWTYGIQKPERKKALWAMTLGYLVFIVPTTFFNITDPSTVEGIPSIMCGFAVLYAVILVTKVLPEYDQIEEKIKSKIKKD